MGAKKSTINSPGAIYHANHGRGRHYSSCKKNVKRLAKSFFPMGLQSDQKLVVQRIVFLPASFPFLPQLNLLSRNLSRKRKKPKEAHQRRIEKVGNNKRGHNRPFSFPLLILVLSFFLVLVTSTILDENVTSIFSNKLFHPGTILYFISRALFLGLENDFCRGINSQSSSLTKEWS